MKRRDFLKTGFKFGVAANALPIMLGGSSVRALGRSPLRSALEVTSGANNNVLVIIQLQGGNDGLNCVVPYTDSNYAPGSVTSLRPTLGLTLKASSNANGQGGDLLPINSSLAFHWAMSGFSTLFTDNKMALVQNVGYPNPILSHFRGTDVWNTATDSGFYASSGWVGRYLSQQYGLPQTTTGSWPYALEFGSSLSDLFLADSGGMGIAINSIPSNGSPGGNNYDPIDTSSSYTQYNTELAFVRTIQLESEIYSATIAGRSVKTNKTTYPTSTLATQLAGIAQIIATQAAAGNMETKIYLVTQGSYDTHSTQISRQSSLLTDLAAAVLAFQQDIEAMGVADNVAMMTYSEFGRRPKENGSGTDHGTAAPHFIIGTNVNAGIYGSNPNLDPSVLSGGNPSGNMTFDANYDFRNVYATVMNEWLMAGSSASDVNTAIGDVLTQNGNETYSGTTTWNSNLGFFKGSAQQSVPNGYTPGLMLMQNYPNPVTASTTIDYTLDVAGPVELGVFSSTGIEIARPVEGWQVAGNQQLTFDASKLASGTYFYRLKTGSGTLTHPMIVTH
ncbi:MAG TPA: DUF1501 domain-containing protein [Candidatus Kapabacteria bacterium]|jgi:uncharacterized protein (DUF1501 family)